MRSRRGSDGIKAMRAIARACSCPIGGTRKREPDDEPIQATQEEQDIVRTQLRNIERMLASIFGDKYHRQPVSLKVRADAADLIEAHFDGIVGQWNEAVRGIVAASNIDKRPTHERDKPDFSNALIRFITHLRDPEDIDTYIYLRKHCQQGMLARMGPGQFNVVHIALKQVLLNHVRTILDGPKMEAVRDAIDERRLLVSQFYIESRERALRASEEKYRNTINHAPDPMYEIDVQNGRII